MAKRYSSPDSSTRSAAPVSRSTITATATTSAPASRSARTASSAEPPVVLAPALPVAVSEAIVRAIAGAAGLRFASAGELAEVFRAHAP